MALHPHNRCTLLLELYSTSPLTTLDSRSVTFKVTQQLLLAPVLPLSVQLQAAPAALSQS